MVIHCLLFFQDDRILKKKDDEFRSLHNCSHAFAKKFFQVLQYVFYGNLIWSNK